MRRISLTLLPAFVALAIPGSGNGPVQLWSESPSDFFVKGG